MSAMDAYNEGVFHDAQSDARYQEVLAQVRAEGEAFGASYGKPKALYAVADQAALVGAFRTFNAFDIWDTIAEAEEQADRLNHIRIEGYKNYAIFKVEIVKEAPNPLPKDA